MTYAIVTFIVLVIALLSKRRAAPAQQGGKLPAPIDTTVAKTFRVGAYNIHRARGTDRVKDLNRIAAVLKGCDLAGLSEIEGGLPLVKQNQLHRLALKLKMIAVFACTQRRWGFENRGNGAISRFTINNWSTEPLTDSVGNHPRCLLHMNVDIHGVEIDVLVTHLARRVDQDTQLKVVLDRFRQFDKAILIGDLNMDCHHQGLLEALHDPTIIDAHNELMQSAHEQKHNKIDWILARGLSVVDAGVVHSIASDHPFYWADFKIDNAKT